MTAHWIILTFVIQTTNLCSYLYQDPSERFHVIFKVELVIVENKFWNEGHDFFDFVFEFKIIVAELIGNFEKGQIKEGPTVNFVVKSIKNFSLHLNQRSFGDLFMYYLFINGFYFERINFIHFRSDVHGCDSNNVELRNG